MKERKDCRHETLTFGSGDYYIFCQECNACWAAVSHIQPEYGHDAQGKPIGANPDICNKGVGCTLSGEIRTTLGE